MVNKKTKIQNIKTYKSRNNNMYYLQRDEARIIFYNFFFSLPFWRAVKITNLYTILE